MAELHFDTIDDAISAYINVRNDLDASRAAFKEAEKDAKGLMEDIEKYIKNKADDLGVDSFKTSSGTAYRSVKTAYRIGSWSEFIEWVKENDMFHCLEKRAAKLAVKEVHDETGEVPPGLDYHAEVQIDIRKPSK